MGSKNTVVKPYHSLILGAKSYKSKGYLSIKQHKISTMMLLKKISLLLAICVVAACAPEAATISRDHSISETLYSALENTQRPAADKLRDARRKPAQVLDFLELKPGMHVAEILAAGGYYTELLSRVVGPGGLVYMQNNQKYYEYQTDLAVNERLKNGRLGNVKRWDKELEDLQLPEEQLDAVFLMLVLHDFYWMSTSPQQVINSIFVSLKPGGVVGVVDHSAQNGSGISAAKDLHGLHRIDEEYVIEAFAKAGFVLEEQSSLLRNQQDKRDKAFFDSSLTNKATDRFALKFKKPQLPK
jgi:predicted methyltransferase